MPGDILLAINGVPVKSIDQMLGLLEKKPKNVALLIQRTSDLNSRKINFHFLLLITYWNLMRLSAVSLALGVLLTACGGGGSDAPAAPVAAPASTQATLDSSNYASASTEAASSALFMLDAPSTALGVDSTDANEVIQFGLAQVPSLGSWFNGAAVAIGVVQSKTVNCPVSGTLTATVTDADNNGVVSTGDSVLMTATNCKTSSTATMNGGFTIAVLALAGDLASNTYNASLKLTYNNLSAVSSTSSVLGNGDITLTASANGVYVRSQSVSSTSFTANATYGTASYSRTLSNYSSTLAMAPNSPASAFKTTSSVKGTITSSALANKSVTIDTIVPFVRLSTDAFPSIGQATLVGATAAKVLLTAQNATTVLLELDANADGVYETSSTKLWSAIR